MEPRLRYCSKVYGRPKGLSLLHGVYLSPRHAFSHASKFCRRLDHNFSQLLPIKRKICIPATSRLQENLLPQESSHRIPITHAFVVSTLNNWSLYHWSSEYWSMNYMSCSLNIRLLCRQEFKQIKEICMRLYQFTGEFTTLRIESSEYLLDAHLLLHFNVK